VVLNAKNDEEEAGVIAEAGKLGAVTVSTQMAGRGTDIRLGGSEAADDSAEKQEVADLGGMHVIGTGRHITERLDNQLRGRAGRQGDPGSSVFFSSWEDDVVIAHLENPKLPTECDEAGRITSPKANALLDHAQRVAEGRLLDVHANTWRYNQLIAQQRAIIVERRNTLLSTATAREELAELSPDRYAELEKALGEDAEEHLERICRNIMLYHLDRGWADHLAYLSDIRESIHLRALGRQNPLDEFHRLAVDAFTHLAADAIEASQQTFETANVLENEPGLDLSKLARPTSTWTYMVHDNPMRDDTLSALSLPGVFR
jgi:preprotein translocase subunit SecA